MDEQKFLDNEFLLCNRLLADRNLILQFLSMEIETFFRWKSRVDEATKCSTNNTARGECVPQDNAKHAHKMAVRDELVYTIT